MIVVYMGFNSVEDHVDRWCKLLDKPISNLSTLQKWQPSCTVMPMDKCLLMTIQDIARFKQGKGSASITCYITWYDWSRAHTPKNFSSSNAPDTLSLYHTNLPCLVVKVSTDLPIVSCQIGKLTHCVIGGKLKPLKQKKKNNNDLDEVSWQRCGSGNDPKTKRWFRTILPSRRSRLRKPRSLRNYKPKLLARVLCVSFI